MEKLKFILLAFFWMSILLPMGEVFSQEQLDRAYELPVSDSESNELSEEDSLEDQEESSLGCLQNVFLISRDTVCSFFQVKPFYRQLLSFQIDSPPRL